MIRRRPPDTQTIAAIEDTTATIRLLESEERMLRQELGLPPVAEHDLSRWEGQAPVPGGRGLTRARRRRGPGRRFSIALAGVFGAFVATGVTAAAAPDLADTPSPDGPPSSYSRLHVVPQDSERRVMVLDPHGWDSIMLSQLDDLPAGTSLDLGGCRLYVTEETVETEGCELRMVPASE